MSWLITPLRNSRTTGMRRPLLVDLRHAAGHAARRHAADVGVVRDVAHEGEQGAVVEHRHRHVDVGQVGAAGDVGIVGDEDVAVVDIAAELLEKLGHEPGHRGDVDGQRAFGLHDEPAGGVHDRRRMVAALLDVGGIGAPHEGDEGLVADRLEGVVKDLQGDGIGG